MLTVKELAYLLDLIAKTLPGGFGYSSDPEIAALQAKLSIMLEAKTRTTQERTRV